MAAKARREARLLKTAELDIVKATRRPDIEQLSVKQLQIVAKRLRQAHDRAKDIGARQKREMRGKADPRGTRRARSNTGTLAKAQVLRKSLERVQAELDRRESMATALPTQSELSRRALELKLRHAAPKRPASGRSASKGMKPKARRKPLKIGTSKEVGRVSQAGKVAQARKDSRNRGPGR
jgi:hypothetical protein